MNSLREFFHTDWDAMTPTDWSGLLIVLVLTALMTALYIWVLRPRNRDRFERYRDFVNHEDDPEGGLGHGQRK